MGAGLRRRADVQNSGTVLFQSGEQRFNQSRLRYCGRRFLASSREVDNIITNPPFNLAFEFIVQGLRLSRRCLALLLPIRYLTGKRRAKLYHEFPPAKVIVIPNKVDFLGFGSPAMEFAWFVWEKGVSQTTIVWADVKDAELAKKTKRRKNA